jgi:hypothetical protein
VDKEGRRWGEKRSENRLGNPSMRGKCTYRSNRRIIGGFDVREGLGEDEELDDDE